MTGLSPDGDPAILPDGAIDCHVHTAPDLVERYETDLQLAREAAQAGMAAVLVKSHVVPTVGRVDAVNEALDTEILYSGIALNGAVGGLNPDAVKTALELGARVVWLPTAWSRNHARQARAAGDARFVGQRIPEPDEEIVVAQDGALTPETQAVLDLVDEYGATLGTGHVSPSEIAIVVEACADAGVPCLVNHPFFEVVDLPLDRQVALAEQGAVMEYCAYAVQHTKGHSVARIVEAIDRIGPDNCVLATDFGQASNPPIPGLAAFYDRVVEAGIDRNTATQLVTDTPADVLGVD